MRVFRGLVEGGDFRCVEVVLVVEVAVVAFRGVARRGVGAVLVQCG